MNFINGLIFNIRRNGVIQSLHPHFSTQYHWFHAPGVHVNYPSPCPCCIFDCHPPTALAWSGPSDNGEDPSTVSQGHPWPGVYDDQVTKAAGSPPEMPPIAKPCPIGSYTSGQAIWKCWLPIYIFTFDSLYVRVCVVGEVFCLWVFREGVVWRGLHLWNIVKWFKKNGKSTSVALLNPGDFMLLIILKLFCPLRQPRFLVYVYGFP